ncbi:MAG TPA: hypothetical protein VFH11_14195 [Gemmatimonadota bacterium]|nr:hypothetical protein [Gemmatimonadota bacterium]
MRTTRQFRVFLVLSAILALGWITWGWLRWRGQAPERSAWAAVQSDLGAHSARIDSLKQVIARMERELEVDKRAIGSAGERIGHLGRQAIDGKLPAAEHRLYRREIDRHNEAVAKHNAEMAGLQLVHAEYSALVDTHNALVDSANALQQRAVQEGIQLSAPDR